MPSKNTKKRKQSQQGNKTSSSPRTGSSGHHISSPSKPPASSRGKKQRKKKRRKKQSAAGQKPAGSKPVARQTKASAKSSKLSKLQLKFKKQLQGAQFRRLNEQLYTTDSDAAFRFMKQQPEKFEMYHQGFAEQVLKWPSNPVQVIAGILRKRRKKKLAVADFGCGDAELARTLKGKHEVHSFDLVAPNKLVTACDMAHVPLEASSVDVAVFCLSLMGTNLRDFIAEAHRVLRVGGELLVAEVKSRFAGSGNATSDAGIEAFVAALRPMNFKLQQKETGNKMFVLFRFRKVKSKGPLPMDLDWEFKACVYKRR